MGLILSTNFWLLLGLDGYNIYSVKTFVMFDIVLLSYGAAWVIYLHGCIVLSINGFIDWQAGQSLSGDQNGFSKCLVWSQKRMLYGLAD